MDRMRSFWSGKRPLLTFSIIITVMASSQSRARYCPATTRRWLRLSPADFICPAYIASKGWIALRLDVGKVDWDEVRELLLGSYALIAPKRLAERVKTEA